MRASVISARLASDLPCGLLQLLSLAVLGLKWTRGFGSALSWRSFNTCFALLLPGPGTPGAAPVLPLSAASECLSSAASWGILIALRAATSPSP